MKPSLLVLSAVLLATALPALGEVSTVAARYRVLKGGLHIGNVVESFTREDDRYRIVSETETAGILKWVLREQLTLRAEGRIGKDGLTPSRYEFRRAGYPAKSVTAVFDHARQAILSEAGGKTATYDLPAGTLDRISAMYQFAFEPPRGGEVSVWLSQGKEAHHYQYRKVGEPVLSLNGRNYPTVHFARVTAPGRAQAELWLSKDHHFLPVRMVFEDSKGTVLEQVLVDLSAQ